MSDKYILDGKRAVPCDDLMLWANWFERAERHIGDDLFANGMRVSTVFLGINHNWGEGPPLLFETMTFDKNRKSIQEERCSTWDEAEAAHERAVAAIRSPKAVRPANFEGYNMSLTQFWGSGPKWTITCGSCGETFQQRIPVIDEPGIRCPGCRTVNLLPIRVKRDEATGN